MRCRYSINQTIQRTRGHVYITSPKQVYNELVKLNGVEFKGKYLFNEDAKVKPKVANPNTINFTSPNRFEPSRFVSNTPDLIKNINNCTESDLHVDFKSTVKNPQQNSKYIFKRRCPIVVNVHPENQRIFSKISIFSGDIINKFVIKSIVNKN